jgi:hypothetical protein
MTSNEEHWEIRLKKTDFSHLEALEIENGAKEVREGVPTEEEDLGESPCSP